jgi:murein DD-endopeptidase MepM/ murein hydrolase activator NlpD
MMSKLFYTTTNQIMFLVVGLGCFFMLSVVCTATPSRIVPSAHTRVTSTLVNSTDDFRSLVYPIVAPRVSSVFGTRKHPMRRMVRHHDGVDLAAPRSAPIRAIGPGVVVFADPYGSYGNLVVVRHENGLTSHYGHCEKIRVSPGQRVRAGEILATVGSTGAATGPHLHLEIRKEGKPLDPETILPDLAEAAAG